MLEKNEDKLIINKPIIIYTLCKTIYKTKLIKYFVFSILQVNLFVITIIISLIAYDRDFLTNELPIVLFYK